MAQIGINKLHDKVFGAVRGLALPFRLRVYLPAPHCALAQGIDVVGRDRLLDEALNLVLGGGELVQGPEFPYEEKNYSPSTSSTSGT